MICNYKGTLTIPKSKPDRIKQLAPEIKEHLINHLENPLPFAHTSKENYALVTDVGNHNIQMIYKTKNPELLLSLYVPILPIRHVVTGFNKNSYKFNIISPYVDSFFSPTYQEEKIQFNFSDCFITKQLGNGLAIIKTSQIPKNNIDALGKERLFQFIKQKKGKYEDLVFRGYIMNKPLFLAALFGNKEDILEELKNQNINSTHIAGSCESDILNALHACITNSDIHNNNDAIEVLFSDPRLFNIQKSRYYDESPIEQAYHIEYPGAQYFSLLKMSNDTKNKKALNTFITKDIHNAKNIAYDRVYLKPTFCTKSITALDLMIESGEFDQEDIDLMKKHGGKTSRELQGGCTIS